MLIAEAKHNGEMIIYKDRKISIETGQRRT